MTGWLTLQRGAIFLVEPLTVYRKYCRWSTIFDRLNPLLILAGRYFVQVQIVQQLNNTSIYCGWIWFSRVEVLSSTEHSSVYYTNLPTLEASWWAMVAHSYAGLYTTVPRYYMKRRIYKTWHYSQYEGWRCRPVLRYSVTRCIFFLCRTTFCVCLYCSTVPFSFVYMESLGLGRNCRVWCS